MDGYGESLPRPVDPSIVTGRFIHMEHDAPKIDFLRGIIHIRDHALSYPNVLSIVPEYYD